MEARALLLGALELFLRARRRPQYYKELSCSIIKLTFLLHVPGIMLCLRATGLLLLFYGHCHHYFSPPAKIWPPTQSALLKRFTLWSRHTKNTLFISVRAQKFCLADDWILFYIFSIYYTSKVDCRFVCHSLYAADKQTPIILHEIHYDEF